MHEQIMMQMFLRGYITYEMLTRFKLFVLALLLTDCKYMGAYIFITTWSKHSSLFWNDTYQLGKVGSQDNGFYSEQAITDSVIIVTITISAYWLVFGLL